MQIPATHANSSKVRMSPILPSQTKTESENSLDPPGFPEI